MKESSVGSAVMTVAVILGMTYEYTGMDNLLIIVAIFALFILGLINWTSSNE